MDDGLLERYLGGRASDEEAARLRAEIEADPSKLDDLFAAAELERDLREALARPSARRALLRKRGPAWPLVAAAAALVAVGLGAYLFTREGPIGEVVRVKGTALPGAAKVYAGGRLETVGAGSAATIRFADGTTADLNGGTKLSRIEEGRLRLDAGTLTIETGRPWVVTTPQAEAKVLGTALRLAVDSSSTRLDVDRGRVWLRKLGNGGGIEVPGGHFAVAAAGVDLVARPIAPPAPPKRPPGVELAARMAPGSWQSIPDTAMRKVAADKDRFPRVQGRGGAGAVVSAWSGGALDTKRNRLVLWGGGYTDYHGNELYAFRLDDLVWERLTDPTPEPRLGQDVNADGTPDGRATYNGLAYLSHADRFFGLGGSIAGTGFAAARNVWTFDFDARLWTNRARPGDAPEAGQGALCSYDPATRRLWWGDSSGLYSYDSVANRWTRHNGDKFYYFTGAIDAKRGLWVAVGNGKVLAYSIRNGSPAREAWATTGGDALVGKANPGLDYDPVRDRIVGWAGGAPHALDPGTKAWTALGAPGSPKPTPWGIFGRWRYVPNLDVFVVVTDIDENAHFFKPGR